MLDWKRRGAVLGLAPLRRGTDGVDFYVVTRAKSVQTGERGWALDSRGRVMGWAAVSFDVLSKHLPCAVSLSRPSWTARLPKGARKHATLHLRQEAAHSGELIEAGLEPHCPHSIHRLGGELPAKRKETSLRWPLE